MQHQGFLLLTLLVLLALTSAVAKKKDKVKKEGVLQCPVPGDHPHHEALQPQDQSQGQSQEREGKGLEAKPGCQGAPGVTWGLAHALPLPAPPLSAPSGEGQGILGSLSLPQSHVSPRARFCSSPQFHY
uniref:Uncharacterized protein n=1 Tax=Colobus angolensis palliatus TaxID=336983 RepID=A0A2K5HUZ2_COLAP